MTTYLSGGWYRSGAGRSLRNEVLDGAIDAAGMLHRAGVSAERLMLVALKVRAWLGMRDPQMQAVASIDARHREQLVDKLAHLSDSTPALHSFIADCVEHIASTADATAFYLHLMHVARMLKLLAHAELARSAMATLGRPPAREAATPRKRATRPRTSKNRAGAPTKRPARKAKRERGGRRTS